MILLALSNKEVTAERALVKEVKVFQDVEEELETEEELSKVSDLTAYLKVCKANEVLR